MRLGSILSLLGLTSLGPILLLSIEALYYLNKVRISLRLSTRYNIVESRA